MKTLQHTSEDSTSTVKTSKHWQQLLAELANVLSSLKKDQMLILTNPETFEFCQAVGQGLYGLRLEAKSDYYREENSLLSKEQIQELVKLGWNIPTNTPELSTPEFDIDGSPNYYLDSELPCNFNQLAEIIVLSFSKVFGTMHPSQLCYKGHDGLGGDLLFPNLKIEREQSETPEEAKIAEVPQKLLTLTREMTGIAALTYDENDLISDISFAGIDLFISIQENHRIRFMGFLQTDLKPSLKLFKWINQVNTDSGLWHLLLDEGSLIIMSDIEAIPFKASYIENSFHDFSFHAKRVNNDYNNMFSINVIKH